MGELLTQGLPPLQPRPDRGRQLWVPTGVLAHCLGAGCIWFPRSQRGMAMGAVGGIVFGLITGAVIAWLWPVAH